MGMFSWIREGLSTPTELPDDGRLATAQHQLEEAHHQLHSMAALYREDHGWQALTQATERDMTRDGLRTVSRTCRVMHIANPLIKRGLNLRAAYVFGSGVGISARSVGDGAEQDVNSVVQSFLDDDHTRSVFSGAQAREQMENALGTDGNVFIALFTTARTGRVEPRTLDVDEISDIITNPEDKSEPWFYRRDFIRERIGERTGRITSRQETVWYPALGHTPKRKNPLIDGHPVQWDAPVYHVKVNVALGAKWGIPDAYAALPWARAYKEFLEDWAVLMKSLSRIAWRTSSKRSAAQQARAALSAQQGAGGVAHMGPEDQLEAVPKTGATIDAESGRPLATMIAAALGFPVTTLLADPGQTGARAVAETLDQPTELEMQGRREVWTETYRRVIGYVIDQAVLAPHGPLHGSVTVDPYTGRETITIGGVDDRTLDIVWPDLSKTPIETLVNAIVAADATGKMPPVETLRLLLRALNVRDVDEIIDMVTDDDGNWIDPDVTAADDAVRRFERGEDPTERR